MTQTVHFISHTHWDREWYESLETYRYRLLKLVDRLLDVLETDPLYQTYMLDGQTIVLEDYLEVRPEKKDLLRRHILDGRILVGPWYILPDEFLVSPETHIRNLMLGSTISQDFGGTLQVGYLPDSFGHVAQMPQILFRSGIRYASFWRGAGREVQKSEFFWEALDGSRVLTVYMPFGYSTACNLPRDPDMLARRISVLTGKLAPFAQTSHLLLMNGSDHVEPDPEFTTKLQTIRQRFPESQFLHSSFPRLFEGLEKWDLTTIPVYRGEWRADDHNYLLAGTLSTRIYLKQKHHHLSTLLEREVEPLSVVLSLFGVDYPAHLFQYLWKILLHNSPHDSICGCSCDSVHQEMMVRYHKIEDTLLKWRKDLENHFRSVLKTGEGEHLVLFNPHPFPVTALIETDLHLDRELVEEVDFEISRIVQREKPQGELAPGLKLLSDGESIHPSIHESGWARLIETPPNNLPEIYQAKRYRVSFVAKDLPPVGFKVYQVVPVSGPPISVGTPSEFLLENEFYRVLVTENGKMSFTDRSTGRSFPLDPVFEDGADAGDEYDYSPCPEDRVVTSEQFQPAVRWVERTPHQSKLAISYLLEIPRSLSPDRQTRSQETCQVPVVLEVSLSPGIRRVNFSVTIQNTACDHRIRLSFFSPVTPDTVYSDGHFGLVERPVTPEKTGHQRHFVLVQDQSLSFWVMNRGLPEYSVMPVAGGCRVAVTLLRSVGWLSRGDLITRDGNAGWPLLTPEAQCLGDHQFQLAVATDSRPHPESTVSREGQVFNVPPLCVEVEQGTGPVGNTFSMISCDNPQIILSALKQRENRNEVVIRFYNQSSTTQKARITTPFTLKLLKELTPIEHDLNTIIPSDQTIEADFSPFEIKTWGLVLERKP